MSKFLKIMIVLLTITAMAAPVVIAADSFSVSGQMRVRAAYRDQGADTTNTVADQRLRVGGKFTVSENVSVSFRTDFSEGTWGTDGNYGRFGTIKDMDRAYIDLNFDSVAVRAGTQNIIFGKTTVDSQDTAFKFTLKGAVPVTVFYSLIESYGADADAHLYGANVAFGGESFKANAFVAGLHGADETKNYPIVMTDFADYGEDVYVAGFGFKTDLGAVKLEGEFDYFTGTAISGPGFEYDAVGMQGYVDASIAAGETFVFGGAFYYAAGADDDEVKYSSLGNGFNGWDQLNRGPMQNYNLQAYTRPYDVFGNKGTIAAQAYADMNAGDALKFTASLVYAMPEDDEDAYFLGDKLANVDLDKDGIDDYSKADSAIVTNIGMTYKLLENTSLLSQVQYIMIDAEDAEDVLSVGTALVVNF